MNFEPSTGPRRAAELDLVVAGARVGGRAADILVGGGRILAVAPHEPDRPLGPEVRVVDGRGAAALPGLANAHTHTPMALMRSYADDMPLMPWLQEKIWPLEAKLSGEDVYWGTRLGCLEMIRTGTTFFNDMYWHYPSVVRATTDAGLRAMLSGVFIDNGDPALAARQREANLRFIEAAPDLPERIGFALGPHAIYTVSEESLRWVAAVAAERGLFVHMHVAESDVEVARCVEAHGRRPVAYLDDLGLLGPRFVAAHSVHLTDEEIDVFAARGVHPVHCPVSNLKLASGGPLRYRALARAGVRVLVGTDSVASNNNLDLFEELKFAALLAKHATGDPTTLPAADALAMATTHAAAAFGLDIGALAPGGLADIILVDLDNPFLFPGHDLAADLVYSAHGRAVRTTICDGRVLMEDGVIPDEAGIRREVTERLARLVE